MLLEEVSTQRIESAIQQMKHPDYGKTVQLYKYAASADVEDETESYTLPDLYRELARRHEAGVAVIRAACDEALKAFEPSCPECGSTTHCFYQPNSNTTFCLNSWHNEKD